MSNLISAEQYKQFALEPCARVVEACRKAGGLTFLHNSEERVPHLASPSRPGRADQRRAGDRHRAGQGNPSRQGLPRPATSSPIRLLMNGTPEEVAAEAERIMKAAAPGGGYIFNTGEMNPRDVPEANMRAMIRAAKRFAADG